MYGTIGHHPLLIIRVLTQGREINLKESGSSKAVLSTDVIWDCCNHSKHIIPTKVKTVLGPKIIYSSSCSILDIDPCGAVSRLLINGSHFSPT
jgi:hypothetical protein